MTTKRIISILALVGMTLVSQGCTFDAKPVCDAHQSSNDLYSVFLKNPQLFHLTENEQKVFSSLKKEEKDMLLSMPIGAHLDLPENSNIERWKEIEKKLHVFHVVMANGRYFLVRTR